MEFLTTAFYTLALFVLVTSLVEMTDFVIFNFRLEVKVAAGVCFSVFSHFALLFIGFFQGASTLILWIRLNSTIEEL
jgi:hypothetical protein